MKYHIIGEKGARNLPDADKILRDKDEAEDMLRGGYDPEIVRRQTGWYEGGDGKMRYELQDKNFHLNPNAVDRLVAITKNLKEGEIFRTRLKLSDLVDKNFSTFAAYDDAKNIRIKVTKDSRDGAFYAAYDAKENAIVFNLSKELNNERDRAAFERNIRKDIAHKLQHYIQKQEEFAEGSTIEREKNLLSQSANRGRAQEVDEGALPLDKTLLEKQAKFNYEHQYGEAEARAAEDRLDFTPEQRRDTPIFRTEQNSEYNPKDFIVRTKDGNTDPVDGSYYAKENLSGDDLSHNDPMPQKTLREVREALRNRGEQQARNILEQSSWYKNNPRQEEIDNTSIIDILLDHLDRTNQKTKEREKAKAQQIRDKKNNEIKDLKQQHRAKLKAIREDYQAKIDELKQQNIPNEQAAEKQETLP